MPCTLQCVNKNTCLIAIISFLHYVQPSSHAHQNYVTPHFSDSICHTKTHACVHKNMWVYTHTQQNYVFDNTLPNKNHLQSLDIPFCKDDVHQKNQVWNRGLKIPVCVLAALCKSSACVMHNVGSLYFMRWLQEFS